MKRKSLIAVLLILITTVACNKEKNHDHDHAHHDHEEVESAQAAVNHDHEHSDGENHEHTHAALGGHTHGHGHLALAVDDKLIALELTASAEAFLGFEKEPTTEEEKEKWTTFESNWASTPENFFRPDSTLGCVPGTSKVSLETEGSHAELRAERTYNCAKSPSGSYFEVRMQEKYHALKKLKVEVLPHEKASFVKDVDFEASDRAPIKLSL